MSNGWIGIDLDGTLAEYHGWVSEKHIGDPIPNMQRRVKQWISEGKDLRIFTARVSNDIDGIVTEIIQKWCLRYLGKKLPVTCTKDYSMIELWDDRCVQVIPNTGIALQELKDGD